MIQPYQGKFICEFLLGESWVQCSLWQFNALIMHDNIDNASFLYYIKIQYYIHEEAMTVNKPAAPVNVTWLE